MIFEELPWATTTWHNKYDYLAPDGSEIRLLAEVPGGGLSHCTLPPAAISHAVYHKTVDEIWYFISGSGEIWRRHAEREEVTPVSAGRSINILCGTRFQFRNTGTEPLCFVIATVPRWPGPADAVPTVGPWEPPERSS